MPHVIQQVRDAIVTQLNAAGVAGGRCMVYKARPQDISKVPFVYVRTGEDRDERMGLGFPTERNDATLFELTIVAAQNGDTEAAALDVRAQIEAALFATVAAVTLGGKVMMLTLQGGRPDEDDVGNKPAYCIRLTLEADIRHLESEPTILR